VSYGIYLWHWILLQELPLHSLPAVPAWMLLTGSTALVATASWMLVERPAINLARRVAPRSQARGRAPLPQPVAVEAQP
jgi:peptidoglycan/LPS O-acetylase OafA/YrhL